MKKYVALCVVVFIAAFGFGLTAAPHADAGMLCYYTCDCSGTPLYCCVTPWGTSCKPTSKWACPQIYNC